MSNIICNGQGKKRSSTGLKNLIKNQFQIEKKHEKKTPKS